jgi:hypothetical protein
MFISKVIYLLSFILILANAHRELVEEDTEKENKKVHFGTGPLKDYKLSEDRGFVYGIV